MIAYIKGSLEVKANEFVIIEANGIGYKVFVPFSTMQNLGKEGINVKLFTYLYIREDVMNLFGFLTQDELGMFELLISVSGVGPKAALSIISSLSPSAFALAVITDDAKKLTKAQGVGAKTAQRIILELKDKIKNEQLSYSSGRNIDQERTEENGSVASEAISALMVLGYSQAEAAKAVADVCDDNMDVEAVVKNALKKMLKK